MRATRLDIVLGVVGLLAWIGSWVLAPLLPKYARGIASTVAVAAFVVEVIRLRRQADMVVAPEHHLTEVIRIAKSVRQQIGAPGYELAFGSKVDGPRNQRLLEAQLPN